LHGALGFFSSHRLRDGSLRFKMSAAEDVAFPPCPASAASHIGGGRDQLEAPWTRHSDDSVYPLISTAECEQIDAGIERRFGDSDHGLGFTHTRLGQPEIMVGTQCMVDQVVQHGIAEPLPPLAEILGR